jgi:hypothetical protein
MAEQGADTVVEPAVKQMLEFARFLMVGFVPCVEHIGKQPLG